MWEVERKKEKNKVNGGGRRVGGCVSTCGQHLHPRLSRTRGAALSWETRAVKTRVQRSAVIQLV